MARVNYGPPVQTNLGRTTHQRLDALGPGLSVASTQRAAEIAVSAKSASPQHR